MGCQVKCLESRYSYHRLDSGEPAEWPFISRVFLGHHPAWVAAAAVIGGIIGGVFGGWLLTILYERSILLFSGLVAMFFAAREIYRLVLAPTTALEVDSGDEGAT